MKEEPNSKNQKISKTAQVGGPVENCLFPLDTEPVFIDALRLNGNFWFEVIINQDDFAPKLNSRCGIK